MKWQVSWVAEVVQGSQPAISGSLLGHWAQYRPRGGELIISLELTAGRGEGWGSVVKHYDYHSVVFYLVILSQTSQYLDRHSPAGLTISSEDKLGHARKWQSFLTVLLMVWCWIRRSHRPAPVSPVLVWGVLLSVTTWLVPVTCLSHSDQKIKTEMRWGESLS